MSYCPKCGREILEESLGCPVCGVRENKVSLAKEKPEEEKAEPVTDFTVEDQNGYSQRFESHSENGWEGSHPAEEKTLHPALKVVVIVMMVMVGGIGAIVGILGGAAMMKSPFEDYRRFGKTMVVVGSVMLALWFLCCVVNGVIFSSAVHHMPY